MSPGRTGSDPAEALLRRTRIRLATVTLLVVTALVIAVGVTTMLTATTLMRQSIDRTLDRAVASSLALHDLFEGDSEYGYAGPLGDADTFLLLVTADGQLLGSTTTADLTGLPDQTALEAAVAGGDDRRDGTYGGADMRLLTTLVSNVVVEDDEGGVASGPIYAQAGFNLTLQNRLEAQLAIGIAIVSVLGIIGAVIVTLVITNRALVPIREAFAAERRFVAAASHELQTPTSIIRASAEILEREHLVRADGTTLVEDIINETDRLGRLVADLLALSSLEAGAASLDVRAIDVGPWFEDVARRARSITESHGLRFSSSHPVTQPLTVQADRDRLDQIVLILVDNAVNHSPPGGEVGFDLAVDLRARTATAVVRDEGPGIPAEDVERIFEPFMRGNGRRRSSGGAGLGLAIARQLTGRLGAELTVASTPGSGATFRLSLPLARAESSQRRHRVASASTDRRHANARQEAAVTDLAKSRTRGTMGAFSCPSHPPHSTQTAVLVIVVLAGQSAGRIDGWEDTRHGLCDRSPLRRPHGSCLRGGVPGRRDRGRSRGRPEALHRPRQLHRLRRLRDRVSQQRDLSRRPLAQLVGRLRVDGHGLVSGHRRRPRRGR